MWANVRSVAVLAVLSLFFSGCVFLHPLTHTGGGEQLRITRDVSADGRYVLMHTNAPIDSADTNGEYDSYRIDVTTDAAMLISRSTGATGAGSSLGADGDAAMSGDGRYVVFASDSPDLVPGDTNGERDIFLRDTINLTTTQLTEGNNASEDPDISANGEWIVFESLASDLVAGDTNNRSDVFSYRRTTGQTFLISRATGGALGNGTSRNPSISANGSVAVYESTATNLFPGDVNGVRDVFATSNIGLTVPVSVAPNGGQGNGNSENAEISSNGLHVAFESDASNLVTGDTNGFTDVFVKSLSGALERVSVTSTGQQGTAESLSPSISGDGDAIAFRTKAFELNGGIPAGWVTVVHDRSADTTEIMNTDLLGVQVDADGGNATRLHRPVLSDDGHYVTVYDRAGARPSAADAATWLRFRSTPTVTGTDQPVVPNGVAAPITITGSGFLGTVQLNTNLVSPGSDGVTFSNIVVVNDTTITAEIEVFNAPVGPRQLNIVIEGTGPGGDAALAYCPGCLTIT